MIEGLNLSMTDVEVVEDLVSLAVAATLDRMGERRIHLSQADLQSVYERYTVEKELSAAGWTVRLIAKPAT